MFFSNSSAAEVPFLDGNAPHCSEELEKSGLKKEVLAAVLWSFWSQKRCDCSLVASFWGSSLGNPFWETFGGHLGANLGSTWPLKR